MIPASHGYKILCSAITTADPFHAIRSNCLIISTATDSIRLSFGICRLIRTCLTGCPWPGLQGFLFPRQLLSARLIRNCSCLSWLAHLPSDVLSSFVFLTFFLLQTDRPQIRIIAKNISILFSSCGSICAKHTLFLIIAKSSTENKNGRNLFTGSCHSIKRSR